MPDGGVSELALAEGLGLGGGIEGLLGMLGIGGGEAAAGVGAGALGAGELAAGGAMNILPEVAQFAPAAMGDVLPAATGALGLGAAGESAMLGGLGAASGGGALPFTGAAGGGFAQDAGLGAIDQAFPMGDGAMSFAQAGGGATPGGVTPMGGVQSFGGSGPVDIGQLSASPGVTTAGSAPLPGGSSGMNFAGSAAGQAAPAAVGDSLDLTSLAKNWGAPALGAAGLGYSILKGQQALPSTQAIQDQAASIQGQIPGIQQQGQDFLKSSQQQGQSIRDLGTPLVQQGQEYSKYLASGTLPPTMQAQLDTEAKNAKTQIVSRYAAQGMPTDPNKNSSLQAELQAVDNQMRIKAGQLGQQLLQGGTSLAGAGQGLIGAGTGLQSSVAGTGTNLLGIGAQMTGMENGLLQTLSNIDQTQTANIGKAIANFAAALAPSKTGSKQDAVKTLMGP